MSEGIDARWEYDRGTVLEIGDQFASACEAFMDLELRVGSDGMSRSQFSEEFNEILAGGVAAKVSKQTLLDAWSGVDSSRSSGHEAFYRAVPGSLNRLQWAFDLFHLAMRKSVVASIPTETRGEDLVEDAKETAFRVLSANLQLLDQLANMEVSSPDTIGSAERALERDYEEHLVPLFAELKGSFKR